MTSRLLASALVFAAWTMGARGAQAVDNRSLLAAAANGAQRSADDKARDKYRHPVETLSFFGITPQMTVVEIWPSKGWYTEIIAPYLKGQGKYIAALGGHEDQQKTFTDHFIGKKDVYGDITVTHLDPPNDLQIAPDGSADAVLTFRNVHNWMRQGQAEAVFKAFYKALKPGGILGVEEHRADPTKPQDPKAESGYVRQDYVIGLAKKAGFKVYATSDINANPKDDHNHPKGVWTLPPSLKLGDQDRAKYLAIGESDRMTLVFKKP